MGLEEIGSNTGIRKAFWTISACLFLNVNISDIFSMFRSMLGLTGMSVISNMLAI